MQDIEQALKSSVNLLTDQLKEAKKGSDEQKIIVDGVVRLTDEYLKCIKGEDDIFNNDAERQKLYAEVEKLKAETQKSKDDILNNEANRQKLNAEAEKLNAEKQKIENDQAPADIKRWIMQIRPDQVINDVIILSALVATVRMEKNGFILPKRLTDWSMKLFGK